MAAPPPRLVPAKQPHQQDQRTPEQRYWRSFKVASPCSKSGADFSGTDHHQGIRLNTTHPLLLVLPSQSRHLLLCPSPNLQPQFTPTHKNSLPLQRHRSMRRIPFRWKAFTSKRQDGHNSTFRFIFSGNPATLESRGHTCPIPSFQSEMARFYKCCFCGG